MVAFLLQTTSSEDLCSEDSSWTVRTQDLHTPFFRASNSPQERLVMERLLVCSPPQRWLSWISYNDEGNSAAPGLVRRRPHPQHAAQRQRILLRKTRCRQSMLSHPLQYNLSSISPGVPSNSAVSVTRYNPRLSKGCDSFLISKFSSEFCIALIISIRRTFSELHSVTHIISSSNLH